MPTREDLLPLEWRFRAKEHLATERMRLLPGGRIAGYRHPNEFYWDYDGARLTLMNAYRQVTSVLELASEPGAPLRFTGPYAWDASIRFELLGGEPQPWSEVDGASAVRMAAQITRHGWKVGAHSYGVPFVYEGGAAGLTIGRFCSIAEGVIIALADHKTSNVTSYPFMTLQSAWPSRPMGADDHVSRGDVTIGNDVWIGAEAFISSGVSIGDGAVIGARSVVTRDVPPYAIAVGSPARVVRHRFAPEIVAALLTIRWWDWPEIWIDAAMPLLVTDRVDDLIKVGLAQPQTLEALVLLVDDALTPPPPPPAPPRPGLARRIARRVRGLFQART